MVKKISLMGLELDNYSFPEAVKIIESFLTDTALSTVLSVNMETLLAAGEEPAVMEALSSADYTVVTDKAILEAVPQSSAERVSEVEEGVFLHGFLNHMYRADRTFYLIASCDEDLKEMQRLLTGWFSYIRIVGQSVIPDENPDYENCVNAVNITVPDVILSSLETPQEEQFLKECRPKLCARIWYGAGKELLIRNRKFSIGRWMRKERNRLAFLSRLHNR